MKIRKRLTLIIGIVSIVMSVWGCSNTKPEVQNESKRVSDNSQFPKTIVDQMGREVVIEEEPDSIVSGYYISTSALIALDQENKLVGIENDADKRPVYGYSDPAIVELPSLGTVKEFDLEECMTLNPDLVVVPTKLSGIISTLEDLGITVLVVNPENEQLLNEMIYMLAQATGAEEMASQIVAYKTEKLDELQRLIQKEEKPSVYLAGNSSLLSTSGPCMYQNTLIENAGAVNVAADIEDTYWAEVSYEQILTWNPEYIFIAADAGYGVEEVFADENLASCDAVKNKKVYKLPNITEPVDSPVPASFLGSLYMANVIRPEIYSWEQYEEAFVQFYENFYQFKPELKDTNE